MRESVTTNAQVISPDNFLRHTLQGQRFMVEVKWDRDPAGTIDCPWPWDHRPFVHLKNEQVNAGIWIGSCLNGYPEGTKLVIALRYNYSEISVNNCSLQANCRDRSAA
ncbi:MAG: hypothetical protein ABH835_02975 [Patescibacteria group bacterium]